jgi:hypothetical protein
VHNSLRVDVCHTVCDVQANWNDLI